MKLGIGEEWAQNLESEEFEQGHGYLTLASRHCCLGVLCVMAVRAGVIDSPVIRADGVVSYDGESQILPDSVRAWAGMQSLGGEYVTRHIDCLTDDNDSKGMNFRGIAQRIRDNVDVL